MQTTSIPYNKAVQGKCRNCHIVFHWYKSVGLLSRAFCPYCVAPLNRTSALIQGIKHVDETPRFK
jgi:hypothetical protein